MFNLETKYRFVTEVTLNPFGQIAGELFRVQYRNWWSPRWQDIAAAKNAEEITRLINMHKKRVTYL